jgi:hypothetical protein
VKSLETAQKDLAAIGGTLGTGAGDLRKDVTRMLRDARRDLTKMGKAMSREVERLQKDVVSAKPKARPKARPKAAKAGAGKATKRAKAASTSGARGAK